MPRFENAHDNRDPTSRGAPGQTFGSFERHSGRNHLLVFVELGEDQAPLDATCSPAFRPLLHDHVVVALLGDHQLPAFELFASRRPIVRPSGQTHTPRRS